MAIGHKPKIVDDDKFDKFVGQAPDIAVKTPEKKTEPREPRAEQPRKKAKRIKEPMTLTIAPELRRKVDAAAAEKGMSRAAYIAMALSYAVDQGIFK